MNKELALSLLDRFGLCQAEVHSLKCPGVADSEDHFTPKCVDKLRKAFDFEFYDPDLLNSKENFIPMWHECHALKDHSTPQKLNQIKWQLKHNGFIDFLRHK